MFLYELFEAKKRKRKRSKVRTGYYGYYYGLGSGETTSSDSGGGDGGMEESQDSEEVNLPSLNLAKQNINKILAAAQRIYDEWDESDRDTYAGGGICHIIADAICDVMWDIGIECTTVSCSYEQHVYVAVKVGEGVYTIDIPYSIYETGGGFNWQKKPDIKFDTGDVVFYKVSSDPDEFENYTALEEGALIPWPKGTVKVDVSDVYDWYKLGQHVSNLKGLGKHDFGKGPPQTVMAFGSEPLEHEYIKDLKKIGLKTYDIDEDVTEGKMAELDMDLEDPEISDRQFEKIYGMTRREARELFSKTNIWDFPQVKDPDRPLHEQGVAEGSENLSYIGNCTDDDVIEHIFGDATNFAQAVEEHGDEFTIGDLVVKYDPESDVHSFYYKKQGVAEENLKEFAPGPDFRDDDDRQDMPLLEFAKIIKLFLGSEYTMIDRKTPEQVSVKFDPKDRTSGHNGAVLYSVVRKQNEYPTVNFQLIDYEQGPQVGRGRRAGTAILKTRANALKIADIIYNTMGLPQQDRRVEENFADGKNPGRKGLAKRMGVPTKASITRLRQIAKSSSGEKQRMAHWMANMKAGKRK